MKYTKTIYPLSKAQAERGGLDYNDPPAEPKTVEELEEVADCVTGAEVAALVKDCLMYGSARRNLLRAAKPNRAAIHKVALRSVFDGLIVEPRYEGMRIAYGDDEIFARVHHWWSEDPAAFVATSHRLGVPLLDEGDYELSHMLDLVLAIFVEDERLRAEHSRRSIPR